jgi:hypothetical protein
VTVLKIVCDTNALSHSIDPNSSDASEQASRHALEKLYGKHESGEICIFHSGVLRVEAENTPELSLRDKLRADWEKLPRVPNDENVSGFGLIPNLEGSFTLNPVSDMDNDPIYNKLLSRRLSNKDARLFALAVRNRFDVFLTRDVSTIIKPHKNWLEKEFSPLKIRTPTQLLRDCTQLSM